MTKKGSETKYIVVPFYVVNIGLFYAFLLTSGLIIAWVTIYRHEECIKELRQMLDEQQNGKQKHLTNEIHSKGDLGNLDVDLRGEDEKLAFAVDDSDQRSKRASNQQQHAGVKGEKGENGRQGPPGLRGHTGINGLKGEIGQKGDIGHLGRKGMKGDTGTK